MNVAKLAPEPRSRNMNGGGPAGAEGEPPNDSFPSLRTAVARSHRTFDVNHLPLALQRVVADLTEKGAGLELSCARKSALKPAASFAAAKRTIDVTTTLPS